MGSAQQLARYVNDHRDVDFELGKHDCFTFTNGAWRVLYGEGYADGIIGKYAGLGPKAFKALLKAEFGHPEIVDCFDAHLTRVEDIPPRGAIVATDDCARWISGRALGIAVGIYGVFVGDKGVVYKPITEITEAWVK